MLKLATLLLALALPLPATAGDPIVSYAEDDAAMNAAIADARRTLPLFYDHFAKADPTAEVMLLKVAMAYEAGGTTSYEHIWVAVTGRDGERFTGILANAPVYIDGKEGDAVAFAEDEISDWMYYDKSGLMQGAFTLRVMLKDLPADQAEDFRRALAPPPEGTGPYE